jgi:succinyl-CoA synthetase alpha subunit
MGHAGAWTGLGEGTAESKYKALENAGVTMVDHPAKFGSVMKDILAKAGRNVKKIVSLPPLVSMCPILASVQEQSAAHAQQRRSYHTYRRPYGPSASSTSHFAQQKRSLHLTADQSSDLLKTFDIPISSSAPQNTTSTHFLGITVARSARSPCIIAAPTTDPSHLSKRVRRFPFDYRDGPSQFTIQEALSYLQIDASPPKAKAQAVSLIKNLWTLYLEKEAITATLSLALNPSKDELVLWDPYLFFDNAAFKSCKRQSDLHALASEKSDIDQEAEKAGIVYIPLASPSVASGSASAATQTAPDQVSEPTNLIGTLVNGAGLAMNTNDVLSLRLLPHTSSANFLDTGGKATSATIATSFKLILSDPRVKVIFVNIFGGLTLGDMIAEGIILAFKDVGVRKPVVVRIRGTNEERGREVLRKADLPILAFDDFEEAVAEVGRLAHGAEA